MKTSKQSALLILVASMTFASNVTTNFAAWARGGGGFHGGGGGGFGGESARGGFGGGGEGAYRGSGGGFENGDYRGDYGHAVDNGEYRNNPGGGEYRGDFGHAYGGGVGNRGFGGDASARPGTYGAAPHVSEQELRAGANQTYNWGSSGHSLSTDAGFGSLAAAGGGLHETSRVTPQALASQARSVRANYGSNYGRYGYFNNRWWGAHPGYWNRGLANDWAWGYCGWGDLAGWWGVPYSTEPQYYDYGDNITYQNNDVYYGAQPAESAETYYDQAQALAESSPASFPTTSVLTTKEWKPLGVFSLVQGSQTNNTTMFQLAVDKKGAIKGTYYNALTNETKPVQGAVDKKTMRAAWIVGDNKDVVYDTGVSNLLKAESPLLLHLGRDKTEQWTLVRLQESNKKAT